MSGSDRRKMRSEAREMIVTAVVLVMATMLFAEPAYVWTGAVDGKWMEPGNWIVKGSDPAVSPTPSQLQAEAITVEFGAIASANTTIDLEGLVAISNIVIKSGAPKYTFGVSADQVLAMSGNGTRCASGRFTVEANAAAPYVPCCFGWRNGWNATGWNLTDDANKEWPVQVKNLSDETLVFERMFYCDSQGTETKPAQMRFMGTGVIKINGAEASAQAYVSFTDGGRLVWNVPASQAVTLQQIMALPPYSSVVQIENGSVIWGDAGTLSIYVRPTASLTLSGEGDFRYSPKPKQSAYACAGKWNDSVVQNYGTLSILCRQVSDRKEYGDPAPYCSTFMLHNGSGSVTFGPDNITSGQVQIVAAGA